MKARRKENLTHSTLSLAMDFNEMTITITILIHDDHL